MKIKILTTSTRAGVWTRLIYVKQLEMKVCEVACGHMCVFVCVLLSVSVCVCL